MTVDEFLQAQVLGEGGWQEQAALFTRRWSSKAMRIQSGLFCGSIYWVLLVSGRFSVTKPLSQIQRSTFLPFQEVSHTPSFGGMGITLIVRILTGWIPFIGVIVTLVLLLPSLAVTVRRLHDTNRTGWWFPLPIVLRVVGLVVGVSLVFTDLLILGIALSVLGSVVGFMALLVFLIQPGNPHPNQYGPDPLQQRAGASEPV